MFEKIMTAIAKALGQTENLKPAETPDRNRISKHVGGRQRPHDFGAKRKTRRLMAKRSRRINRAR